MALHPLENARWGFESNCFVCEPKNDGGLKIPFFHDDHGGTVVAEFSLDDTFSGAPSYVHGGVVLTVLDEAMAWATIALASTIALTKRTTTDFLRPVKVGETYKVVAKVISRSEAGIDVTASLQREDGKPCAEARARFAPLGAAQAVEALRGEVTAADSAFLGDK